MLQPGMSIPQIAIVTGGSRGIGAAIAKSLGANGYSVAVNFAADRTAAEHNILSKNWPPRAQKPSRYKAMSRGKTMSSVFLRRPTANSGAHSTGQQRRNHRWLLAGRLRGCRRPRPHAFRKCHRSHYLCARSRQENVDPFGGLRRCHRKCLILGSPHRWCRRMGALRRLEGRH